MRGAFAISIVRFNIKRKNVVWAPAFGGPIGFSLVSLMDNTALVVELVYKFDKKSCRECLKR